MVRIKEITCSMIALLTFYEFCVWAGLSSDASLYLSLISTLAVYSGSGVRFFMLSRSVAGDLYKLVSISFGGFTILQRVRLRATFKPRVYVNLAGFVVPVALSLAALTYLIYRSLVPVTTYTSVLLFLTATYNRLSRIVSEKGVFISVASSIAVTTAVALALGTHLKLNAEALFLTAYSTSVLAASVGIDLINLRLTALFKSKSVVIGGYGFRDAIFLLPAVSALTSKMLYNLIAALSL
ncbi:MAG: DUF1614 domain-containing protein [Zestosphaera sp.]